MTAGTAIVVLGRVGASRVAGLLKGGRDLLPGLTLSAALAAAMLVFDAQLTRRLLFPAKVVRVDVP